MCECTLIKGYFSNLDVDMCLLPDIGSHSRAALDSAQGDMWPELRAIHFEAVFYQVILCDPVKMGQTRIGLENKRNDVSA